MRYLCIIYLNERMLDGMSRKDYQKVVDECLAYEDGLRKNGKLVAAEALESTQSATTVQIRGARRVVTDGPFAETKEQVAGFFLIEARDLNDAIRVAEGMPQAQIGSIEVRPIRELKSDHVSPAQPLDSTQRVQ